MFRTLIVTLVASAFCLHAQPEKTAWEVLKQDLADKNPDKRRQAVTAIGSIGLASEAVQLVEKALKDDDPVVRQTAAAVLGEMKSRQSIPTLKTELDDPSPEVAFAAAKALWVIGDRSGRDLIEDVLTGQTKASDGLVTGAMRDAKKKMHDPKALALMGLKEGSGALLGPFSIGIVAAEQAFKDGSVGARTLAVTLLADECDPQTVNLLEWAYANDKSWAVKAAAAKALGTCGNHDSIARLETGLSDSNVAIRCMSAAAIIRLSSEPARKRAAR
jgi:HEAT repeat protein